MTPQERIDLYRTDIEMWQQNIRELQWNIQQRLERIAQLEADEAVRPSKGTEFPEVGNYPFLYRKSATGAMEGRTVHVLHVTTGQESESRAFWPDMTPVAPAAHTGKRFCLCLACNTGGEQQDGIRIDPPYDR